MIMLSAWALSLAMSTTSVPPCSPVVNHGQVGHYTQPTIRRYERYEEDHGRRLAWDAYTLELDKAWKDYRAAGSTDAAFQTYKKVAGQAKTRYIYQDPYYAPILPMTP
jgi:hypothetical protein